MTLLARPLICSLLLLSAVLCAGCGVDRTETGQVNLWGDAPVADFTMKDQTGKTVTRQDLLGRPWVACFIFTRCGLSCPRLSGEIDKLTEEFKGSDIRFVSFSVDPEYDTPAVLAKYAKKAEADPNQWKFLTSPDKGQLYELVHKSFKVPLAEHDDPNVPPEFKIIHSNLLLYVDEQGRVRGKYDGLKDNDLAELRRFLKTPPMVRHFPLVNASLNGLSCGLLVAGWVLIRMRKARLHKWTMLAAFAVSIVFLGCYLTYHYHAGSKKFDRAEVSESAPPEEVRAATIKKTVYYSLLITHVVLAAAVPVLAIVTIVQGLRAERTGNWPLHRRFAWVTFPIWLYVSVTGVVIYLMLYRPEMVGM